ncbi:hypothetical protein PU629_05385 [Pullulanibacillus sp. KACC 23026]|uniref:globin domain-containing protein n=1 Tax=Pullulanibacillus sp. KACC 23026 TaxID=3028315 RepID=UPI0023B02B4D|nr:hypothetical protein [Pullulanibacillus sp. KACC 23026]WEG13800.1 hypothetical protein PU629_05385 [Pullulanibacillus sp. KACC 23026]
MGEWLGERQKQSERVEDTNQDERQATIDELVDRFYARLIQDPYYSRMFAERQVDIEVLKSRQKVFIFRLAQVTDLQHSEVSQVQERHSFGVDPDRAKIWLKLLTETMEEMDLATATKEPLLANIQFLMNKMLQK